MPSSPNYKRDYKTENANAAKRGDNEKDKLDHRLRRAAIKAGKAKLNDGKDLDHIVPTSKGGANTLANAREVSKSANRSFARNKDGSLKSQTSKKERKAAK